MDVTETPDQRTMFLVRVTGQQYTIVEFDRTDPGSPWRMVGAPSFSGRWRDLEEVLTPDGNAMMFSSNRPAQGSSTPIDGHYNGKTWPQGGGRLWIVRRSGSHWGSPALLASRVNATTSTFSPAITRDGTLYFMHPTGSNGKFHIFVSQPPYNVVEPAPFASATAAEFDPTVSADGKTVIFSSTRGLPSHTVHLFVVYRQGTRWTPPRDLGRIINFAPVETEARILPGGRLCYSAQGALTCAPY